jgi:hypothetical protein
MEQNLGIFVKFVDIFLALFPTIFGDTVLWFVGFANVSKNLAVSIFKVKWLRTHWRLYV